MRERQPGENTPAETRHDANAIVDREKRYKQIIEVLDGMKRENGREALTAKEIAVVMFRNDLIPTSERNFTSPRLTELTAKGIVEPAGKVKCKWTGRTVTAYRLREGA